MLIGGAVGMVYAAVATTLALCHADPPPVETAVAASPVSPASAADRPADTDDTAVLVRRMLAQSRHALLLRKQVVGNLSQDQFLEACEQLHARMGLVPEGEVVLRNDGTTMRRASLPAQPRPRRSGACTLPRCSSTATR